MRMKSPEVLCHGLKEVFKVPHDGQETGKETREGDIIFGQGCFNFLTEPQMFNKVLKTSGS